MDLFESSAEARLSEDAPLAARMRPRTIAEVAGQSHLLGPGGPLGALFDSGAVSSLLLWGPPGSGKTTIARLLAENSDAEWIQLSAISAGVADVRREITEARRRLGEHGKRTLLFLDEIHRFNKAQQDSMLSAVEEGVIILVGATTENPYFEVNAPLMSRSLLFKLEALNESEIVELIERAMTDDRGLLLSKSIEAEAMSHIASMASGDARNALNSLEWASLLAAQAGAEAITLEHVEAALQNRRISYDRSGDQHYDVISAFIKSMRGSNPDAALHWLARMINAGEDPRFIVRRMVVFASEDVGNADPRALTLAVAAAQAVEIVGMPEARINLAQAVAYLAQAPKSNASYIAISEAIADVDSKPIGPVPIHLRDAGYGGAGELGHGAEYRYPHDYPDAYVAQEYMPDELKGIKYYRPTDRGYEVAIGERIKARESGAAGEEKREDE